jgi:DNA topoisomerase-1
MKLVIVESPAKAKTIEGYLGKGYKVLASYGHVRDLPKSKLGINPETFDPEYIIPVKARKNLTLLKKQAAEADEVIIATDEDREGEAIGWHVLYGTNTTDDRYVRITFHEITKTAILSAIQNPRKLNMNLVDAQQSRRVLDRLVGYNLSPLLWKKVRRGLSAGRVQSVALKLIVDREKEINAFNAEEYWEVVTTLNKKEDFEAKLTKIDGKKSIIENQEKAGKIVSDLKSAEYVVKDVERKSQKRQPAPPFTTSTLQQEASRKLSFTAKKTMMIAQKLYEGMKVPGHGHIGLITYMRTDSMNLSAQAISEAQNVINSDYGKEYLASTPRIYKKKKGAQEAHEAIRPTSFERRPGDLESVLDKDELRLYEIIYKRALASQMTEEILDLTAINIEAGKYTLRANGKIVKFDGFSRVYLEGTKTQVKTSEKEVILPEIMVGDQCRLISVTPEQKFTKPPARYSEASLVKALEEHGVGRPSTYASIISTIVSRRYARVEKRYFYAEKIGFIVSDLLTENFPEIVDISFTAKMEEQLDDVAEGKTFWKEPIKEFWGPFSKEIEGAEERIEKINTDEATEEVCEKCGRPMVIKEGRFGRFLACTGYPECKNAKPIVEKVSMKCPKCEVGDVVSRKTKKGRTFYGCSRWPDCDWAAWKLPEEEAK